MSVLRDLLLANSMLTALTRLGGTIASASLDMLTPEASVQVGVAQVFMAKFCQAVTFCEGKHMMMTYGQILHCEISSLLCFRLVVLLFYASVASLPQNSCFKFQFHLSPAFSTYTQYPL